MDARETRLNERAYRIEDLRFCELCGAKIKKGFGRQHVNRCQ